MIDEINNLHDEGWQSFYASNYDAAIQSFEKVLSLDPDNANACQGKIASLRRLRNFEAATQAAEQAIEKWPDKIGILDELGWIYFEQKHYEEAINAFDEVLLKKPNDGGALQGKIASLRRLRNFEAATQAVEHAIRLRPDSIGILDERGWIFFEQKLYEQAINAFDEALSKKPDDEGALQGKISALRCMRRFNEAYSVIQACVNSGKEGLWIRNEEGWLYYIQRAYENALNTFDAVLQAAPLDERALQGKISCLRRLKRYDHARILIDSSLRLLPESIAILSERGWLHFDRDELNEAYQCFVTASELAPDWIQLKFSQVEILIQANRRHKALETLLELKSSFPLDLEVREELGRYFVRQGEYAKARKEFEFILNKDRNDLSGVMGLGAVYFGEGHYDEAESLFRQAIETSRQELFGLTRNDPTPFTNLAWALVRQATDMNPTPTVISEVRKVFVKTSPILCQAEDLCNEARQMEPPNGENAEALACLGIIAYKRGQNRESEDYLRASIDADPKGGHHADLGALYIRMGRYEDAQRILEDALRINCNDAQAYIELGNLHLQMEEPREAIRKFRQAMAIDANSEDAAERLAIALMSAGDLDEAEKVLRTSIRRLDKPKRWRLHLTLCQLLTRRGDDTDDRQYYEDSLDEANTAVRLKPNHPDPYFCAGIVRSKLENYSMALRNFRYCMRLDKDHFEAERNARRVHALVRGEKQLRTGSFWGSVLIGATSFSLLISMWYYYFQPTTPHDEREQMRQMITIMTPVLLGLLTIAFLLPGLIRLKLPGMEADMSQPRTPETTAGPKGDIGFGGSASKISSGPR